MKVLVMSGHTASGNIGSGAVGYINESDETRKVAPKVVEYLKTLGVDATFIKLDKGKTSSYLYDQVELANSKGDFDVVVQIHFNAGSSDPTSKTTGTETYYRTDKGKIFAQRVNKNLSTVFTDRGAKNSKPNLYWLKHTNSPAILIEVCFVDDKNDVSVYKNNFDKICGLIAEGIANKSLQSKPESKPTSKPEIKPEPVKPTKPSTNPPKEEPNKEPNKEPVKKPDKVIYNLENIVTYFSDVDSLAATILGQKKGCPVMKKEDFDKSGIKSKNVYQVGGKPEDTDKYTTFKNVAKLL